MTAVAQWHAVTKRYQDVTAVEQVSLRLEAGEAIALVGHNGAGKTTLIKLLLGLIRPSEGSVLIGGVDPAGAQGAQTRRKIGFLPENVAFHGAMKGSELMSFYARLKGESEKRNAELLEQVGIAHAADRRVATYSKGMRQRLGIAQALIGEPRLLLFDEPTSGLDPDSRREVYEMIDRLRQGGATVLISTHALSEIEPRVDRIAIMNRGRLLAAGTLASLRSRLDAEARMRVRVRSGTTGKLLEMLPPTVRCAERSDTAVTLLVSAHAKMQTLRVVVEAGEWVDDVEMVSPGLPELYAQLTGAAEEDES
ncbi:MAG TPA: ABC transporter ATP-binding protein [Steroidobacter sp.]|uniref:ABC transporter ATP-binding protein n=1 Tax=Steroidobacter sp. TaxID=1978227 RepID=UPI002ED804D0